jgi:hypothetical protein
MPDPVLKEEMAGCWPHPYILHPLREVARLCRPASIRIDREPNGSMLVGVHDSVGAAIWPTGSTLPRDGRSHLNSANSFFQLILMLRLVPGGWLHFPYFFASPQLCAKLRT